MLTRVSVIVLGFIIVAIVAIWYASRPTGALRLAINEELEVQPTEMQNVAGLADARVGKISEYYSALSLRNDGTDKIDPVPGWREPGVIEFADIVSFILTFETSVEPIKFKGEFKGDKLMEALYGWLGFSDYYLVIAAYSPCDRDAAKAETNDAGCRRIAASLWPLEKRAKELMGDDAQIADQLAVYLFKSFLKKRHSEQVDSSSSVSARLTADELTDAPRSLEETARGLRLLQMGMRHPQCVTATISECLDKAQQAFETALIDDPHNAHALLGSGLIRMRRAQDAARGQKRIFVVQDMIVGASNEIAGARQKSSFLTAFLNDDAAIGFFELIKSKTLPLKGEFLRTAQLYGCVNNAYREADYSKQLGYLERIESVPPEFGPYLVGYKYEALLNLTTPGPNADRLLLELDEIRKKALDNWIYDLIYGSQACRLGTYDQHAQDALNDAVQRAPSEVLHYDALIWRGYCLALNSELERARLDIKKVHDFMDSLPSDREREARTLAVDLGYFYSTIGEHDEAARHFLQSLMDPYLVLRVRNDPLLQGFRDSEVYDGFIADALKQQQPDREPEYVCDEG